MEKLFCILCQDLSLLGFCHSHAALITKLDFRDKGLRGNKLDKRMKRLAISSLRRSFDLLQTTKQSLAFPVSAGSFKVTVRLLRLSM